MKDQKALNPVTGSVTKTTILPATGEAGPRKAVHPGFGTLTF